MLVSPVWAVLRTHNFMLLWWAGLISWLGNGAMFIALPVYVYSRTNSTLATALSVMANALASTFVGQIAGVYADRWDRRRTLIGANLLLTLVTLAFLEVLHAPWWLALPVAFVQSAVGQFLGPAEHALLPTLVGLEHLGAANGLNALNGNLARLLGPALGGLLVARTGFAGVVIVDALSYLLAAGLVLFVRVPQGARSEHSPQPFWNDWRTGLSAVRRHPLLRISFLAAALVGFGEGFVSTLMAPWVRQVVGGDGAALGLIMSVQAVGGLAAGALLALFAHRLSAVRRLLWGSLLSGAFLALIFNTPLLIPALWPVLALTAVAGLPFTAWGTAQTLLTQTNAEPQLRGRVFGLSFALFSLAQFVGMGVSGLLGDRLGVLVINVDATTYLLSGLVALGALGRSRPRPPADAH